MTGIYPSGTTCATIGSATAGYSASYDAWGNETGRTYNGATDTLTYDALNRLTTYSDTRGASEQYVYDASGNRVLKRSTSAGTTTLSVYPSSNEEYDYSSTGTLTGQLHYYTLAGYLIASFDGTHTTYYLTDALGSVLMSFSQSAILGEQIYGPYGNTRYTAGTINTAKGYTGQIQDAVTGLDYYNARYYDPVAGVFLSVDSVQGNDQGCDPYSYTDGNPETMTDPTGQYYTDGTPYDRGYIESDPNGDGGHYVLAYIPASHEQPLLNDEWVNYTHFTKKGDVDVVAGWATNGKHQVQCAFGCNPSSFMMGAGAFALADPADYPVVAVGLLILAGILLVGIIANAVNAGPSAATTYSAGEETPGGKIFTKHSADEANKDGFTAEAIDRIISTGKKSLQFDSPSAENPTGVKIKYTDKKGNTVILDGSGEVIITVFGKYSPTNPQGKYQP